MAISIKFTKFDNTPWGFRLAGGSDFPQPLTVIKVLEGGLAECMGLQVGDVVVRLNDEPVSSLTHGQAHEALIRAGNNFVVGVLREADSLKAVEQISGENIVPYKIPLAELPPVFPEEILKEETVIEGYTEETCVQEAEEEPGAVIEELPEKPRDADSEIVPNQNLTDDEIAQLILEEEELLTDKGVLGVNFKKLKPRVPILKESKVLEELQHIATEEPGPVEQLRRTTVFLQKPQRPVPQPARKPEEAGETSVEAYRVVIRKQQRRSVTDRLLERGLLKPGGQKTPEPPTAEVKISAEPTMSGRGVEGGDAYVDLVVKVDRDFGGNEGNVGTMEENGLAFEAAEVNVETKGEGGLEFKADELGAIDENDLADEVNEANLEITAEHGLTAIEGNVETKASRVDVESPRRGPSRRRRSRFYTRPHYFRRCLLGRRAPGEAKRTARQGSSSGADVLHDNAQETTLPTVDSTHNVDDPTKTLHLRIRETREGSLLKRLLSTLTADEQSEKKSVSLWRTRYAEKILDRSVGFVVACLRSIFLRHFAENPPVGRDVAKIELPFAVKTLLGSLGASNSTDRKGRLYLKGRYFQHVLNSAKDVLHAGDLEKKRRYRRSVRTKARYVERCLESRNFSVGRNFVEFLDRVSRDLQTFYRSFYERKWHSKRMYSFRTRYFERILKRHVEALCFFVENVRSQVLRALDNSSCLSRDITIPGTEGEQDPVETSPGDSARNISADDADAFSNFLRSSGDYVSTEVFHRGSRRLSRSFRVPDPPANGIPGWLDRLRKLTFDCSSWLPSRIPQDSNAFAKVLRSSGDFVSTEVFHRGSRRLSRSTRRSSGAIEPTSWLETFGNANFDYSGWLPLRATDENEGQGVCEEKNLRNPEREGRRLSFVPTVLYEGLTNRIGVDFTRLVAYAFVPCTSIVLLYMYK